MKPTRPTGRFSPILDGFARILSVPFGAGLRFTFVLAAGLLARLTPQFRIGGTARLFPPKAGELFPLPLI